MNMSLHTGKRLLWLTSAALLAGLLATTAFAWLLPVKAEGAPSRTRTNAGDNAGAKHAGKSALPLSAYSAIWERKLQRPLVDVAAASRKPPRWTLMLTFAEGTSRAALIQTASGETVEVREGQTVGGAKIIRITDGSVQFEFDGHLRTLGLQ